MKELIKTVDWNLSKTNKKKFIDEIRDAFHNVGCVAIINHPVNMDNMNENQEFLNGFLNNIRGHYTEISMPGNQMHSLFLQFRSMYIALLKLLAQSLDSKPTHFVEKMSDYDLTYRFSEQPISCASLLTILSPKSEFQIWNREKYVDVQLEPNAVLVCVGEILEYITSGFYQSAIYIIDDQLVQQFSGLLNHGASIETCPNYRWLNQKSVVYKTVGDFLKK